MSASETNKREVVIRPRLGAGWRVELPKHDDPLGVFVVVVASKPDAVALAARMRPNASIRIVTTPLDIES